MKNLFRFNFTKETAVAFAAGAVMIALSLLMLPFMGASLFDKIASFVLRDLLMIFGLGVVFVSLYVERNKDGVKAIGFTGKRNVLSLLLNVLFAAGLLAMFLNEGRPQGILEVKNIYAAAYILVAGIFEITFIYGRDFFDGRLLFLPSRGLSAGVPSSVFCGSNVFRRLLHHAKSFDCLPILLGGRRFVGRDCLFGRGGGNQEP